MGCLFLACHVELHARAVVRHCLACVASHPMSCQDCSLHGLPRMLSKFCFSQPPACARSWADVCVASHFAARILRRHGGRLISINLSMVERLPFAVLAVNS